MDTIWRLICRAVETFPIDEKRKKRLLKKIIQERRWLHERTDRKS